MTKVWVAPDAIVAAMQEIMRPECADKYFGEPPFLVCVEGVDEEPPPPPPRKIAQRLADRLVYAATARCPCGAGMAYDPASEGPGPFRLPSQWECAAILLGTAIPANQPGAVEHECPLPFAFYSIKGEGQPSAGGATTRPKAA